LKSAAEIAQFFAAVVGAERVLVGDAINDDYGHDEALSAKPERPAAVLRRARRARAGADRSDGAVDRVSCGRPSDAA